MNLLAYIQGKRRGKEAHEIERKAMEDPFLADALEGFDVVDGHHIERIASIRTRVSAHGRKINRRFAYISIAASLLLCVSMGGYFLINKNKEQSLIAKSEVQAEEKILAEKEPEEGKLAAGEILEELDVQAQDNIEAEERVYSPPPPVINESEADVIVSVDDESLPEVEDAIVLPEIAAVEEVPDIRPKEDSLMIAQTESEKPGKLTTSPNATQRALTTSGSARKPEPKIGMSAYKKYLKESMIRPKEGDCAKKKGNVIVEFKINAEGKPHSFVYRKKLCEDLDKEAVRLIENGPVWVGDTDKPVMLEVKF